MQVSPSESEHTDSQTSFELRGDLTIRNIEAVRRDILEAAGDDGGLEVDLSGLKHIDTAGAWLLTDIRSTLAGAGRACRFTGVSAAQATLIDTVENNRPEPVAEPESGPFVTEMLHRLGGAVVSGVSAFLEVVSLLGEIIRALIRCIFQPWKLRWTSLVYHMQDAGLNAVPIVALMAFLIGVVLAFQGSTQLRQFGAEIFAVDLIGLSILRELGILLTAIIVAGRSSSAMTAAIGSMKMREEIDAMRTLGLDPVEVLVLPRVLALILTLPLLGFLADVAGLVGGGLMVWLELGISPNLFLSRLSDSMDGWQFGVGIIKAPFFALTIGLVGCYMGLKVEGNAESLGRLTSKSVVVSIFLVIVIDAVFSIFFSMVGV